MSSVEWLACAEPGSVEDVVLASRSLGAAARPRFVESPDVIRWLAAERPGSIWPWSASLARGSRT